MTQRKQSLSHEDFAAIRARATEEITRAQIDEKIGRAVEEIRAFCAGKNVAYAWSAGKDSIALALVAEMAGVTDCVLGICDLEYPAFVAWAQENAPSRLETINTGLDMDWLVKHPEMLFPMQADLAMQWFKAVQHKAQRQYYRKRKLDAIILGRRRSDGNFVGRGGENHYESQGVVRYSPIADWSHAEVFAAIDHYGLAMPPIYGWPRGYRVGTHPWPARQWCESIEHGWAEVFSIDPQIVIRAAERLPSADAYLATL